MTPLFDKNNHLVLGYKVNKPFKILIKTSNTGKYIEFNIQNTEAPRIDNPII